MFHYSGISQKVWKIPVICRLVEWLIIKVLKLFQEFCVTVPFEICWWLTVQSEPYQPHSTHPPIGGGHAVTGDQNSVPSSLSPKRMLRSPKLKYEALEINEIRGPFERKVLMRYSYFGVLWEQGIYTLHCCWGPLWKQSSLLMHYSCCWAPLKARNFTHYSCKGGPEASASLIFP